MFNQLVVLQQQLFRTLFELKKRDPALLKRWHDIVKMNGSLGTEDWNTLATNFSFPFPQEAWALGACSKVLTEQVHIKGTNIEIEALLGSELSHLSQKGFRTKSWAVPGRLKIGDVLATGERITALPREGGNGSVLIRLESNDPLGLWLDLPARIALALKTD